MRGDAVRRLEIAAASLPFVVLLALLVRLATFFTTVDIPGDGPSRAIDAYEWSRHPFIPTWGWWPPGFLFLNGIMSMMVPDPLISGRIVNLVLGTVTVPLFFLLARRAFADETALFGATVLACLPLHVELSASSFAETSFAFEMVAGMLCMTIAFEEPRRRWALIAGLAALSWASMTRYETWWVLPVFPLYAWWRTGSIRMAVLVGALLAAFPCAWTIGNMLAVGDPLLGFTITKKGGVIEGIQPGTPLSALRTLADLSVAEFGSVAAVLLGLGVIVAVRSSWRSAPSARVLYMAVAGLFWLAICYVTIFRGPTFYSRYLVLGYILALPWIALPFLGPMRRRSWVAATLLVVVVVSFAFTGRYTAPKWVTHRQPSDVRALAT